MKKILIILFVFISLIGKSQSYTVPTGLPQKFTSTWYWFKSPSGYVLIDTALMFQSSDTIMKPIYNAIKFKNNVPYYWDLSKWNAFGSGGDTSTQGLQSVITRDNVLTKGDTILSNGHTLRFFGAHDYQFRAESQFQVWHTDSDATPTQAATFLVLKNDSLETPYSYLGAQIAGSAAGGAVQFYNNSIDDETKKLKLGIIDNNNVFDNMMEFHYSGVFGNKIIAPMVESANISSVMIQHGDTLWKTSLQHLADSLAPYITGDTILPVTWEMTLNNQGSIPFSSSHYVHAGNNSFQIDSANSVSFIAGSNAYGNPNSVWFGAFSPTDWEMGQFDSTGVAYNFIQAQLYGGMNIVSGATSIEMSTIGNAIKLTSDSLFIDLLGKSSTHAGYVLTLVDSATGRATWQAASGGGGSVSSVALTVPTGLSVSGSPVTTSGTLAITTVLNGIIHGNGSGFTASNVVLTSQVTGILPIANGGTNSSAALSGNTIMISNGTAIVQGSAGTTTTVLHGNASGSPIYSAVSLTADVSGTLGIGNGGTNITTYTTGDLPYASATNVLSKLGIGSTGQVLTVAGGIPSWAAPASIFTRQVITSGTSGTVTGGNYLVTIDPSSTIASYTLTLPASPSDKDIVQVDFGGTLTSGTIVTALTVSPNSGQTILDNTPPVSSTTDNTLLYRYRAANTTWYRFKP